MRGCSRAAFLFATGLLVSLLMPVSAEAAKAVLIEDDRRDREVESIESSVEAEPTWNRPAPKEEEETNSRSPSSEEAPAHEPESVPAVGRRIYSPGTSSESFSSVFELRRRKKLGVGASFLGRAGFVGLDAELNLTEENSALVSVGGGPGYTGASVGWKWVPLHGGWHPTASVAVSSWVADEPARPGDESIPAFFGPGSGQSAGERARQIYLVPGVGLQTLKLSGEGAGALFFVEVLLFAQLPNFDIKPLGSVGARYFF